MLIGTPLLLVLVFAFGFVLIHPAKTGIEAAAVDRPAGSSHKAAQDAATVAPLPLTQTTLPTLTPAPASSTGNGTPPVSTASPQTTNGSTTYSIGVQSAVPNNSGPNSANAAFNAWLGPSNSLFRGPLLKVR